LKKYWEKVVFIQKEELNLVSNGLEKSLIMKYLNHIPSWLKSKYLIAGSFFLVWMFFFDPKDISSDFERREKLNELQNSEQHLNQLITESDKELDLLKNNTQSIEKYAREKYMMKKNNEDLFILNSAPADK
jgi:cell division protein DivIC